MKALSAVIVSCIILAAVALAAWMVQYKVFDEPYAYRGHRAIHRLNRFTGIHQVLVHDEWISATDWESQINSLKSPPLKTQVPPRLTPTLPPLGGQTKPVIKVNRGKESPNPNFDETEPNQYPQE